MDAVITVPSRAASDGSRWLTIRVAPARPARACRPAGRPSRGNSAQLRDRDRPPARCAMMPGMSETPADDGLDGLSSKELHDLAVRRAKRHVDVRFFWHLMEVLPAAEAVAGRTEDEQVDLQFALAHIDD